MKSKLRFTFSLCLCGVMTVFFAAGCSSRAKASREDANGHTSTTVNPMQHQIDGGSYCVQTITQGPPLSTPIHFSNKEVQSDGSSKDFESDLVGDKLDITVHERHPATDFDRELNTVKGVEPTPIRDGFAESVRTNHY